MNLIKIYFTLLLFFCSGIAAYAQYADVSAATIESKNFDPSTLIWFNAPAAKWEDALPVGNGKLGAMVFGKPGEERIQLNEDTYWTGGPYSTAVKGAYKYLPEVQKKVFEGKFLEAHNLFGRGMMGYPVEQQKYQCLGDLFLAFPGQENVTGYKRWLNLETGTASTIYTANGITYKRDVFASAPNNVIVVRITADKPASISLQGNIRGVRNQTHSNYATDYFRMDGEGNNCLILTGKSADYMGIKGALKYEARLHAVTSGGTMQIKNGIDLVIKNADTVTLYFVATTNFVNYKDVSANAHERVTANWKKLQPKTFDQVHSAALDDYQKLFNRVNFHLDNTPTSYLPTNQRRESIQNNPDPSLAALCYQFARYLMISCSRPGTEPANLQGIWNQDANPMWDAKYTTNINLQMNYWPVEGFNLPECAEPLVKFVKEITDEGAKVAREHYNCRGWVFHQNSDIWRVAAPMDGPTWGTFTTAGAWLTNMLYEHYLYTMDTAYLRNIYPVIKGSVQFFMDFLVMHPNGKWLVTNPSTSPENFPMRNGNQPYFDEVTGSMLPGTTICAGSSIDMQILYDLFTFYSNAAKKLGTDAAFASNAIKAREKLVPPQIGRDGLLQEWADDWGQLEDKHRHLSPLYGLYPGNELWVKSTPALTDAYKKILEERGDVANGFSRAWKMCLWARLGDGNRSYSIFKGYLKDQCYPQLFAIGGNALQVDATFGVAAGINEMLLQSQQGFIDLLPALPAAWANGEVEGVMARGGFQVNMRWKNAAVTKLEILSKSGGLCRIKVNGLRKPTATSKGLTVDIQYTADGIAQFNTVKNGLYTINMQY